MSSRFSHWQSKFKLRHSWQKWLVDILIIISVVVAVQWWMQRGMADGDAPVINQVTLNGKQVALDAYHGKPVLIHFWADWCPYCRFEQSSISDLSKNWPVITVAYQSGPREKVEAYAAEQGISDWDIIVDETGVLANNYGVKAVPATYIVDGSGIIRSKTAGFTTKWGLWLRLWYVKVFY